MFCELILFIPYFFFIFSCIFLFIYNLYLYYFEQKTSLLLNFYNKYINRSIIYLFFLFLFFVLFLIFNLPSWNIFYINFNLHLNYWIILVHFIITFFYIIILLYNYTLFFYLSYEIYFVQLSILFSFYIALMSFDFLTLFICLEIYSLGSCILITADYNNNILLRYYHIVYLSTNINFNIEAAIKYFIGSTLFSIIFIYGWSLVYIKTGSINFFEIQLYLLFLANDFLLFLAYFLILIALLFKFGVVPVHFWITDVYSTVSFCLLSFLAIIPKLPLLFIIIFISDVFTDLLINCNFYWILQQWIFWICGFFSFIVGFLGILYTIKIKRFFAYLILVGNGYLIISLVFINFSSLIFLLYFSVIYLFIFLVLIGFFIQFLDLNNNSVIFTIFHLSFFLKERTYSLYLLIFLFLNIIGLPPVFGFLIKFLLLSNLTTIFWTNMLCITWGLFLFCSVIILFYFLRILKNLMFFRFYYFFQIKNYNFQLNFIFILSIFFFCLCLFFNDLIISFLFLI